MVLLLLLFYCSLLQQQQQQQQQQHEHQQHQQHQQHLLQQHQQLLLQLQLHLLVTVLNVHAYLCVFVALRCTDTPPTMDGCQDMILTYKVSHEDQKGSLNPKP